MVGGSRKVRVIVRTIATVDYHTAGEPFRIVPDGVVPPGRTVLERRDAAPDTVDDVRRLLVDEPRGHADMYGGLVVPPDDDGADLGVVFFHAAGYSTACGHGTIALVTWAIESGRLALGDGSHEVRVDVPSGRVTTRATVRGGRVESVAFANVPSFVLASEVAVAAAGGALGTIAYGGAFYVVLPAAAVGLDVRPADVGGLIAAGRAIKAEVEAARQVVHPVEPGLRGIYGVVFTAESTRLEQSNVTVFADGEVDRSPCGSGTSARLAVLHAEGRLAIGETLVHHSVVGTSFEGRVLGVQTVAGLPAVMTEVVGSAWPTGEHRFLLHPGDPLGTGFRLR